MPVSTPGTPAEKLLRRPGPSASTGGGSPVKGSWWAVLLAAAVIVLAALAAFQNSFTGVMVAGDHAGILDNPSIRQLAPLGEVLFPSAADSVAGHPLVSLSLAINYALNGTEVWGYHAVNLAIHILAALVLFGIVRRTLLRPRMRDRFGSAATALALAATLVWAVHPLQTASVTYIIHAPNRCWGCFIC